MGGHCMNLAELLLPKSRYFITKGAERAEQAESQQLQGVQSPPHEAEKGGNDVIFHVIRPNPPAEAEATGQASADAPPNPPFPPAYAIEIEKPLPVTVDYFYTQGMKLTPDDLAFIARNLPQGTARRNALIRGYVEQWQSASKREARPHRRQNRGRLTANTWLRTRNM